MSDSATTRCPECGASWDEGFTCEDAFHDLMQREFDDPGGAGVVHHLTVMCYNLQHPSRFTDEAMDWYRQTLQEVVEQDISGPELRRQTQANMQQGVRNWKVTRRVPAPPVQRDWTMHVLDVALCGRDEHVARVREWARSIVDDLKLREAG